jgi:hypothetical protein
MGRYSPTSGLSPRFRSSKRNRRVSLGQIVFRTRLGGVGIKITPKLKYGGYYAAGYRIVFYWDNGNTRWLLRMYNPDGTTLATLVTAGAGNQSSIPAAVIGNATLGSYITVEYISDVREGATAGGSTGVSYALGSPFTNYR